MTVLISPVFNQSSFDDLDGHLLSGGKIFAYVGGSSSVLQDTYTTSDGDVLNTNPIVLNSSGQLSTAIWLTAGETYNLVLTKADGTTVLKGFDGVTGVSGSTSGGGGGSTGLWVLEDGGTFLSGTSFLVTGNKTAEFFVGNRVRLTQTGGFTYGVVSASTFSSPNTSVTIVNDGVALNSSLSAAEWSLNVTNGKTVDAGSVSFFNSLPYSTSNTVGNKINTVNTTLTNSIATTEGKRARDDLVQTASGGSPAYTVTTSPAIGAYTVDQIYVIKFLAANVGSPTLNISSLGAKNLVQYSSAGAKVPASVAAGMVSQVAYDGTDLILLDPLPAASVAPPHGWQAFASNATFTVPANVYSLKVTTVGGGGGGAEGSTCGDVESGYNNYYGGSGGPAAAAWNIIATTPGTTYSVSIGAGGPGGGTGGTTAFGITLCTASGGGAGTTGGCASGTTGAAGSSGTGFVIPGGASAWGLYGQGGLGGLGSGTPGNAGAAGVVVVEW